MDKTIAKNETERDTHAVPHSTVWHHPVIRHGIFHGLTDIISVKVLNLEQNLALYICCFAVINLLLRPYAVLGKCFGSNGMK